MLRVLTKCMLERQVGNVLSWLLTFEFLVTHSVHITLSQAQVLNTRQALGRRSAFQTGSKLIREFPNATVQRDSEFRIVKQLSGRVAVRGAKTPSQAAQLFLKKYKRQFTNTPGLDEFRLTHEVKSLTGTSLSFTRLHAGFPVVDDRLSIFVDKGMAIIQIKNDFTPVTKPLRSGPLSIVKVLAIQTALTAVGEQETPVEQPSAILSIAVLNGMAVAVWNVTFKTRKPAASWQILVDAKSDEVIVKRNVALYSSK